MCLCVRACVCVCVRACMHACICVERLVNEDEYVNLIHWLVAGQILSDPL